jgi:FAD-linked oxidoreductase
VTRPGGTWTNWGRTESVRPARVEYPATPDAVRRSVLAARTRGLPVKAVGAGHSFSGIAVAPGVLLDLSDLTGLVRVDRERRLATFRAGTRLHRIPKLLAPYGLAMANLGDIDRQSISGAISTGTHGTGAAFGGIATQVAGVTLVTGEGEFLTVDDTENADLLPAVALGLGALGILVEVTLRLVPAFVLHAVEHPEPIDDVVATFADRAAASDHVEFYWFPHTDVGLLKTNTRLPESAVRHPLPRVAKFLDEELLSNGVFTAVCALGRAVPAITPPLSRLAAKVTGRREYTDASTAVFTQHRGVRFREMEYAVPAERLAEAFDAVRALIDERRYRVSFPIEVRIAASDDLWLSTASGRATGYIAVHRYWRENPATYFEPIEELLRTFDGRPHWGKMHTRTADDLRPAYPRFDDFTALRDRLDPDRVFRNRYLRRVLGE